MDQSIKSYMSMNSLDRVEKREKRKEVDMGIDLIQKLNFKKAGLQ